MPPALALERETEVALATARAAGRVAMRYYASDIGDEEKPDLSPVTIADRECEALITRELRAAFPDDGVLGEEGASQQSRSGRRCIIDPIDGTRDFVRRAPFWAIQIALQQEERVVLGLIYVPTVDEMVHAVAGGGCFFNGAPVRASAITRLDKSILTLSGLKYVWNHLTPEMVRYLTTTCWTVRAYSGCYDVTMVARGKADIWLSGSGMEWDYAPVRIIAAECGAAYFTLDGSDAIDRNNCVMCGPGLELELRRLLKVP